MLQWCSAFCNDAMLVCTTSKRFLVRLNETNQPLDKFAVLPQSWKHYGQFFLCSHQTKKKLTLRWRGTSDAAFLASPGKSKWRSVVCQIRLDISMATEHTWTEESCSSLCFWMCLCPGLLKKNVHPFKAEQ